MLDHKEIKKKKPLIASLNPIFSVKCIEMQSDQNGPFSVIMIPAMIKKHKLSSDEAFDKFTHTVMFITCILICINLPSCPGFVFGVHFMHYHLNAWNSWLPHVYSKNTCNICFQRYTLDQIYSVSK